jgi:NADPH2:quinone reductase
LYPLKEFPTAIGVELAGTIVALPKDETVLEDPDYKKRGFTVGAKVAVVRISEGSLNDQIPNFARSRVGQPLWEFIPTTLQ